MNKLLFDLLHISARSRLPFFGQEPQAAKIRAHKPLIKRKPLTARDRQIAELLESGAGNKTIANKLHISVASVKAHRRKFIKV